MKRLSVGSCQLPVSKSNEKEQTATSEWLKAKSDKRLWEARHSTTTASSTKALSSSVVPVRAKELVWAAWPCSTVVIT